MGKEWRWITAEKTKKGRLARCPIKLQRGGAEGGQIENKYKKESDCLHCQQEES